MDTETFGSTRLRALVAAASAVAGQTQLDELLGATVDAGMELTGAPFGALGVLGEHGTLSQFIHRGVDERTARSIGAPPTGRGVLGVLSKTGATIRLDDIAEHDASLGFPPHHPAMVSFLGVSVRAGESVFGNLYLTDKTGGFTEEDQAIVEALALIAGSAIKSLRLQSRLRRAAVAEDRERIARDIHDGIIQNLFAVGLSLQGAAMRVADPATREMLATDARRIDDAIASLRQFIFDLSRPAADQRNLRIEVEDLIMRLTEPRETQVQLTINGSFAAASPGSIDDVLQLIREGVSNALRHAQATSITVELHEGAEAIGIIVADDGVGFDLEHTAPGLGLANMASRTERSDGSLRIDSSGGSGTTVHATIPYS